MNKRCFVIFMTVCCLANYCVLARPVQVHCDKPDSLSWDEWDREWRRPQRAIERNLIFEFDREMGRARVLIATKWYAWRPAMFIGKAITWKYTDKYKYSFDGQKNAVVEETNGFYLRFPNCFKVNASQYN